MSVQGSLRKGGRYHHYESEVAALIADTILQMDCYKPHDITEKTKAFCAGYGAGAESSAPGFILPPKGRKLSEKKARFLRLSKGSFSRGARALWPRRARSPRGRGRPLGARTGIKVKVSARIRSRSTALL